MFPSSTKREIRHFHIVVVQRRLRNVRKSVIRPQSCCSANLNLLRFCSSGCRRRRFCFSSLFKYLMLGGNERRQKGDDAFEKRSFTGFIRRCAEYTVKLNYNQQSMESQITPLCPVTEPGKPGWKGDQYVRLTSTVCHQQTF